MSHWNKQHAWKIPILQELLNKRIHNSCVEGFEDNVITKIINMFVMSNDQCGLFLHNFAYFFLL